MFLKSIGMKESVVLNWVKIDRLQEAERKYIDKRKETRIRICENCNIKLKEFFNLLPKEESSYC